MRNNSGFSIQCDGNYTAVVTCKLETRSERGRERETFYCRKLGLFLIMETAADNQSEAEQLL